ncbi:MAG TPA: PAS domain-containing protein, partial [Solirubrobacteraceae bacterium]|nr:PAS domain-containing protein [Solirubrobacteraceae bacterium]
MARSRQAGTLFAATGAGALRGNSLFDGLELAAMVVDLSDTLVSVFDREGRVVAFNRACEKATGFCACEVLGQPARETIVSAEDADAFERILERSFEAGEPSRVRGSWMTKDGGRRIIEFTSRPIA